MYLISNIIWFVLGGFVVGLAWWFAALLAAIIIIGIPWAIAAFHIGMFSFWPFGRQIVERQSGSVGAAGAALGNLIWALLAGWRLALGHLIAALLCAITIIGIPFAFQYLKLASLSFFPFGKEIADRVKVLIGVIRAGTSASRAGVLRVDFRRHVEAKRFHDSQC